MEQTPSLEKVSHVSFDTYLEYLVSLNMIDGKLIEDEDHAFYVWVTNKVPAYRDIDGVTLLSLYEKNVLEGDMSKETFYRYCTNHGFACPLPQTEDEELRQREFNHFLDDILEDRKRQYTHWATEQGINVTDGAVTVFIDLEGNSYRIKTDFENYGEIIA